MVLIDRDPEDEKKIIASVNHLEADLTRALPGTLHDRKRSTPTSILYTAPLSWASCLGFRGMFGDQLQVGAALTEWAAAEYQGRIAPCLAIRQALDVPGDFDQRLKPFQRADVAFLGIAERAVLGNDMGTGKTPVLVSTLRWLSEYGHQVFPVCIITTGGTKIPWRDHWLEWWPFAMPFVIDGTPAVRRKQFAEAKERADAGDPVVVIINWEAVRLHSRLERYPSIRFKKCKEHGGVDEKITAAKCEVHEKELNGFGFRSVVTDECHRMKDPKTQQTRAVWAVQHGSEVRYAYSMSGTLGEHPGHLWSILHGIAPMEFPGNSKYIDRYCQTSYNPYGEMEIIGLQAVTRDEFFGIVNPRFRRMPLELVQPQLPPEVRTKRVAPMGTKQAKAYKELKAQGFIVGESYEESFIATNNLTKSTNLLQLSAATCEVEEFCTTEGELKKRLRLIEPSSKLDVYGEVLEEHGGRPLVAACVHRDMVRLAAARMDEWGVTYRTIIGGMSAMEREANRVDFQEGRAQVLLMTCAAGGEGLNMTVAGTLVFLQRPWSLFMNLQTERRVRRIGSEGHDQINIIDIVVPGTVEVEQARKIKEKIHRLAQINQDLATIMAHGGLDHVRMQALQAEQAAIMAADDLSQEMDADDYDVG